MRPKNDQVFQLSLAEIAFMICFMLMILLGFMVFKAMQENKRLTEQASQSASLEQATKSFETAKAFLSEQLKVLGATNPDEVISKLVKVSEAKAESDRLKVVIEDLEKKLTAMIEIEKVLKKIQETDKTQAIRQHVEQAVVLMSDLEKALQDKTPADPLKANEIKQRVEQLMAVESKIKESLGVEPSQPLNSEVVAKALANAKAFDELGKQDINPVALHLENKDLRGQVAYLQNRLNAKGGIDFPACWADEVTGKVQLLFTVKLRDNDLTVEPAWPASRQEDAMALPNIKAVLANRTPTYDAFMQAVEPIGALSRQKDCRHYVRIDSSIEGAVLSDRRRLRIEGVFYKHEVRR